MNRNDDIPDNPANQRLVASLGRLAEAIDRSVYPGRAWPVRRHAVLRVYWPVAAAAAMAAAVLLVVVLLAQWRPPTPLALQAPLANVVKPQAVQIPDEGDWDVPADIDPSLADMAQPNLAGQLDLEVPSIPSLSMPSLSGDSFTWSVPQMDLTPKIDLDRNVPAEDSQTRTPQSQAKDEQA